MDDAILVGVGTYSADNGWCIAWASEKKFDVGYKDGQNREAFTPSLWLKGDDLAEYTSGYIDGIFPYRFMPGVWGKYEAASALLDSLTQDVDLRILAQVKVESGELP